MDSLDLESQPKSAEQLSDNQKVQLAHDIEDFGSDIPFPKMPKQIAEFVGRGSAVIETEAQKLIKGLVVDFEDTADNLGAARYLNILGDIFSVLPETTRIRLMSEAASAWTYRLGKPIGFHHERYKIDFYGDLGRFLWNNGGVDEKAKVYDHLLERAGALGVDPREAVDAWRLSHPDKFVEISYQNLWWGNQLNDESGNACEVLSSNYGVYDFYRYPKRLLVDQASEDENAVETPYGLVICARSDHNGSFYEGRNWMDDLYEGTPPERYYQKEGLKGRFGVKVVEVRGRRDLISKLNSLRHKFGKASFAIIGAHGTEDAIHWSEDEDGITNYVDLLREGSQALELAFVPEPIVVIAACSTGVDFGFGQKTSELGATVIAPDGVTETRSITPVFSQDAPLRFLVDYKGAKTKVYKKGHVIE